MKSEQGMNQHSSNLFQLTGELSEQEGSLMETPSDDPTHGSSKELDASWGTLGEAVVENFLINSLDFSTSSSERPE